MFQEISQNPDKQLSRIYNTEQSLQEASGHIYVFFLKVIFTRTIVNQDKIALMI